MKQLNFKIFRNAMGFSAALFPNKQIIFDCDIQKGQSVLLYGKVSDKLIAQTLKAIGNNGKLYIIGRDLELTKLGKYTNEKYQNRVIVNPFFEDLKPDCLNLILIINAVIDKNTIPNLAIHAKLTLVENGKIAIIDDNTTWDTFIEMSKKITWLQQVQTDKILLFKKLSTNS